MRVILALAGNHSREIGNASSGRKMDPGKSCLIETTPTALSLLAFVEEGQIKTAPSLVQ